MSISPLSPLISLSSLPPFPPVREGFSLLGVPAEALTTQGEQAVTVTFVSEEAGSNNALGVFALDETGNFVDGEIVIPSTHPVDPEQPSPGDSTFVDIFPGATQLGFFLIMDGGDIISGLPGEFLGGDVQFCSDGDIANAFEPIPPEVVLRSVVTEPNGDISVVETSVDNNVYFTFDPTPSFPLTNELNDGGFTQVIAGASPAKSDTVRIGFEDLVLNEADLDFNDLVVDVTFTDTPTSSDSPGLVQPDERLQVNQQTPLAFDILPTSDCTGIARECLEPARATAEVA